MKGFLVKYCTKSSLPPSFQRYPFRVIPRKGKKKQLGKERGSGGRGKKLSYRVATVITLPGPEKGGVIPGKLLDVDGAGRQLGKNIRNVQLSSLKHHHYAYQSFSKRGGVEQCVTA